MIAYRTPGVYFEVADNRSEALGLVRTDIAGFVGIARRGPVHRPVKVESWTQFVSLFGAHAPQAYLAYAVAGFFSNGGATCWVVRVADPDSARPSQVDLTDNRNAAAIRLTAACRIDPAASFRSTDPSRLDRVPGRDPANDVEPDPGAWGDQIGVVVRASGGGRFALTLTCPGEPTEVYRDLTLRADDDRFVVRILNGDPTAPRNGRPRTPAAPPNGSRLVTARDLRSTSVDPGSTTLKDALARLSGGHDGLAPSVVLGDDTGADRLRFIATPAGAFGRVLQVTVCWEAQRDRFALKVEDLSGGPGVEQWDKLSLNPADPNYVVTVVNNRRKRATTGVGAPQGVTTDGGSTLVSVRDLAPPLSKDPRTGAALGAAALANPPAGFDLRLMSSLNDVRGIPTEGKNLIIVAAVNHVLHFRIFDGDGKVVVDTDEKRLTEQARQIEDLRKQLESLWSLHELTRSDKGWVITAVTSIVGHTPPARRPQAGQFRLSGGLSPTHLTGMGDPAGRRLGLAALELIDEVSVVAMPDLAPPQSPPVWPAKPRPTRCDPPVAQPAQPPPVPEVPQESAPFFAPGQVAALYNALVLHGEQMRDRVVLIDPPAVVARIARPSQPPSAAASGSDDGADTQRVLAWLDAQGFDSKYAALYYPWLRVDDPLAIDGSVRAVPPSGHVAGVFARTDRESGVHKPPANVEVAGAWDVTDRVNDLTHGDLNERGVNVIRPYPGRGIRVSGARTLSSDSAWRFLNVRRLLLMIESAILRQTNWVVFEPHNITLRGDLDRVIRNFLDDLWRRGMLDGATPNDAYEVRCDETTNPPEDVDAGRLVCVVGVQPPAPAEFVIVRVGKTLEGTEITEDRLGA